MVPQIRLEGPTGADLIGYRDAVEEALDAGRGTDVGAKLGGRKARSASEKSTERSSEAPPLADCASREPASTSL